MEVTQIILIVFILLLVIAYPILISSRNKKENQRMQTQTNSLKRGDKVLTTSGVYGTIIDLIMEEDKKVVVIETGTDKQKGYVSVDAYAIYQVFKEETKEPEVKVEDKKEEVAAIAVEPEKTETKTKTKKSTKKETVVIPALEEPTVASANATETSEIANIEVQVSAKKPRAKKSK